MSFVQKYNPSAVMYVWQGGMIGGYGIEKLLTGKANPSAGVLEGFLPILENKFSNQEESKNDIIKSIEEILV